MSPSPLEIITPKVAGNKDERIAHFLCSASGKRPDMCISSDGGEDI